MAANIHAQPLWYANFSNIRMGSHATMDIDRSGGQPPSIGDVRQMVVSEPSGSNQMYSDGQPPSVNDVCRREASQSEASCNRYKGPDEHEVRQVISENYMMGSTRKEQLEVPCILMHMLEGAFGSLDMLRMVTLVDLYFIHLDLDGFFKESSTGLRFESN